MSLLSTLQIGLVGLLVGAVYALIRVKSPAPPVIAIVGLVGMLGASMILGSL